MKKAFLVSAIFFILLPVHNPLIPGREYNGIFIELMQIKIMAWQSMVWAGSGPEKQDNIQWFKDEMKISPKYIERQEGILGVSWAHFLTMIF